MKSVQNKLTRVRPPRVRITYDMEISDAIERRELPLLVLVLSDVTGDRNALAPNHPTLSGLPPIKDRALLEIDRDNFNDVMTRCQVRLKVDVDDVLCDIDATGTDAGSNNKTTFVLAFNSIEDFAPLNLIHNIKPTADLYEARRRLRALQSELDSNDALDELIEQLLDDESLQQKLMSTFEAAAKNTEQSKPGIDYNNAATTDFIEKMLAQSKVAWDDQQIADAVNLIGQFTVDIVMQIDPNEPKLANDLLEQRISSIDTLLTRQINQVIKHAKFQSLEATWRGLHFLVMNTETSASLKIKLLIASKQELQNDLQKARQVNQSALFRKICEQDLHSNSAEPCSFMVGDYEFGQHSEDIELLRKIAGVAAAANAPFVTSAYAKLFDTTDLSSLLQPRNLSQVFEPEELVKWRNLRGSSESRYIALTLPKVLLRLPYGPETVSVEGIDFEEDADECDAARYLWGNAAYILSQRITNAFAKFGWLAAIRGMEGGGLIEGLPTHRFTTTSGDIQLTSPTYITIRENDEKALYELGFMPILHSTESDKAFFAEQASTPFSKYSTAATQANSPIPATLPGMLNASRFAQYIKVILREKKDSFLTKDNASDFLNNWISDYVLLDDDAPLQMKANYPLRDARISVDDSPDTPGKYIVTVQLRPHFQLDELSETIQLVVELL